MLRYDYLNMNLLRSFGNCCLVCLFLFGALTVPVRGVGSFSDGGVHDLSTQIGSVVIENNSRLNVLSGGSVRAVNGGGSALVAAIVEDTSILSIAGGSVSGTTSGQDVTGIQARANARIELSAGSVDATTSGSGSPIALLLEDSAHFEMTGGDFRATTSGSPSIELSANDNSTANISGGDSPFSTIVANGQSRIVISETSISFARFVANDMADLVISGGDYSHAVVTANDESNIVISGGDFSPASLFPGDQANITLVGQGFNYPLGVVPDVRGTVRGQLLDGTPFSYDFQRGGSGSITLAMIPEPGSLMMFVFGSLTTLSLRRRCEYRSFGRC